MDIQKYLSGMLDYNPNLEWVDEQQFTADGTPIPISGHPLAIEAVPRMMTPPEPDRVHEANVVGQELKKALIAGAKEFLGGGMFSQSKPRQFDGHPSEIVKIKKPSEKPGWMMAEGTNFWSVNENDPYWQTKEGYDEAMALYGFKPGWIKEPVEPKQMLNVGRNVLADNLKKYF